MPELDIKQLEKDQKEIIKQRDEFVAQMHMANGAIQLIDQQIEKLKATKKPNKK